MNTSVEYTTENVNNNRRFIKKYFFKLIMKCCFKLIITYILYNVFKDYSFILKSTREKC